MEGRGTPPPRPAALALWAGGEATRIWGIAKEMGGGKDIRVVGSLSRRFSRDYERLPETVEAMIYGAMSRTSCCVGWRGRREGSSPAQRLRFVFAKLPLRACLVKVRVRMVSYAISYEKAVSD
jgi:hypothetical protein